MSAAGLTGTELAELCRAAERAARTGGEIVAGHTGPVGPAGHAGDAGDAGRARGVEAKAPGDYVTATDHGSEEAIREVLAGEAPEIRFFGEEQGGSRGELGWLADPLDGTANFLHGFPAVGVSVALVERGRPVVGVVHAPFLGSTWRAFADGGTERDGEPVRVSERPVEQAICATGFPFKSKDRLPGYLAMFESAFETVEDLRRPGAASLDLAWTADGVFDGFFELGLGPWDVAAGALLIREAGGVVTDWHGDERAWLDSGDILAGPPHVHEALLALARAALGPR